jgi:hypothetical protein
MFSITYVLAFSQPSQLSRILSANRVLLRHLPNQQVETRSQNQ